MIVLITVIIPKIKLNKARALLDSGDYESAYVLLEEIGNRDAIASSKYERAVALTESGNYEEAYILLKGLDYKDSIDKLSSVKKNIISKAQIGSYVYFGSYEQDNDTSNGNEDIEWLVLDKHGDKLLLISRYVLDYQQYNTSYENTTWEQCSLRKWLNSSFFSNSFSSDERKGIQTTNVTTGSNYYKINGGGNTADRVFILEITEAKNLLTKSERQCNDTTYASARGGYSSSWWLRLPGDKRNRATTVTTNTNIGSIFEDGDILEGGDMVTDINGVRPALWLDLNSLNF